MHGCLIRHINTPRNHWEHIELIHLMLVFLGRIIAIRIIAIRIYTEADDARHLV